MSITNPSTISQVCDHLGLKETYCYNSCVVEILYAHILPDLIQIVIIGRKYQTVGASVFYCHGRLQIQIHDLSQILAAPGGCPDFCRQFRDIILFCHIPACCVDASIETAIPEFV